MSPRRRVFAIVLLLAAVTATIGVLVAESDYFGQIFKPLLFYVFSVPKSIFLPMFILIMGIGFQQKVAYAAFSTLFVVIMSATSAVESRPRFGPTPPQCGVMIVFGNSHSGLAGSSGSCSSPRLG